MGGNYQGTRAFFLVLAILGTAILAAGCGDSDSDATAAVKTGSLSKAEFVKQAGKVCKEGQLKHIADANAFINENDQLKQATLSTEGATKLVNAVIRPVYLQEAEEIAELGAPESDATEVAEIVAALEADMDDLKAHPQKLLRARPILPAADQKAEEYGLTLCATVWV